MIKKNTNTNIRVKTPEEIEAEKKRKSTAATNICAIISLLLLFYMMSGLN